MPRKVLDKPQANGKKKGNYREVNEMQGFIEVKTLTDDSAILLPIAHITAVVERDYGTFIETGIDGKGRTIGIPVAESYENIKQKIYNSR